MIKSIFQKYKHAFLLLYGFVYFPWFLYNEKISLEKYHIIYVPIDDKIPFIDFFILPYLLWFVYVAGTMAYFFFKDVKGFYKLCFFLFSGMTLFLIISTIYPNGQNLRPSEFANENIFTMLIQKVYTADGPVNIFPSIHTYNSIGAHIAIARNETLKKYKGLQIGSFILMISIVCSTVFIKQHSILDLIASIVLSIVVYQIVYGNALDFLRVKSTREPDRV
nr:phosphatase PAP2 family protein [Anaerosacchariphilus polymeriproducens]